METIKTAVLIGAAVLVFIARPADAESKRMYRYTDASGKTLYAKDYGDVPVALRPSASLVAVPEREAGEEEGSTKPKNEDKGKDGVRFTSQLKYKSAGEGKTAFEGEVKNFLDSSVSDAILAIVVVKADGAEQSAGAFQVSGEKGNGRLEPGESAKVAGVFEVDFGSIRRFGSSLSWQTTYVETGGQTIPVGSPESGENK
ncbi:MAG: hypothetical protein HY098_03560 [Nitrospinae bacterium]|nr:hypothetical protein [Nitrospinota bacterium]